jgi:hypothetical protein
MRPPKLLPSQPAYHFYANTSTSSIYSSQREVGFAMLWLSGPFYTTMFSVQLDGHLPVVEHIDACLHSFQNAADSLAMADMRTREKLPPGSLVDQLGRFRIWSGDIGGQRRGSNSLDHRLCDASHLRDRLLELLQGLKTTLVDVAAILKGEKVPWEDMSDSASDDDEDDENNTGGMHEDVISSTTELAQLLSNITEINTCLLSMSPAVRNPAPHDQFKQSSTMSMEYYEVFDIAHVQQKYPSAAEYLTDRLGKAISRRRQYFRYREEQHQKLVKDLPHLFLSKPLELNPSKPALNVATATMHVAIEEGEVDVKLEHDFEVKSQTSYASSLLVTPLRVPPMPKKSIHGEIFECPLCFCLISCASRASWRRHVYQDLHPYVSL